MSKDKTKLNDFSDEIRALQDIKGSMAILTHAGAHADDYSELFSYQLLTADVFKRHIEALKDVVKKLKSYDSSGVDYQ